MFSEKQQQALYSFWEHMCSRIESDANIQYYCGHQTETLRLAIDVWISLFPDINPESVKRILLDSRVSIRADVILLEKGLRK
jgi:hypothetical protein